MVTRCQNCGRETADGAVSCSSCGSPLGGSQGPKQASTAGRILQGMGGLGMAIGVIAACVGKTSSRISVAPAAWALGWWLMFLGLCMFLLGELVAWLERG